MATIKAIEGHSVHQIQSGQVIVDLRSVVKELVENSLDAGATSIDIRFKNYGLDSIEVQDNGKGIAPEDFDTIALKHYTSKLASYEDLTSLETFGFRGEALSSLCALSNLHIVTARADDGAVGKKLMFENSGQLKSSSVVAAQKGTTVAVENLFSTLPVRRKELEKNIKREYSKVLGHLQAYACISVGVRFAVSNQMPKGNKVAAFSTKSNTTTKENITNVFGAKTLLGLVKLDLHLEMEPRKAPSTQSARNWSTQATDRSMEVRVEGHISKPVFGEGRQAPDRQMFFVNSRPCGLPQVSKAVNEVYKSFNVSQTPFIFANLVMDTNAYDVNVSPDKRTIMLHDQTALLESLKTALTELFEQTDHTVPQSQLPNRKLPSYGPLTVPRRSSTEDTKVTAIDASESSSDSDEAEPEAKASIARQPNRITNGTPPSLIHDWIGRDTERRSEIPAPRPDRQGLSKDKKKFVESMQQKSDVRVQAAKTQSPVHDENQAHTTLVGNDNVVQEESQVDAEPAPGTASEHQPDPTGTPYDDLFSQRPPRLPRPVQDFNALMDRDHAVQEPPPLINEDVSQTPEPSKVESEPIPAIATSSQKATPGPVQNAFDRMRPKRTPLQTAEITIGDTTTTAVIGSSQPYKRRKVHQPANSQTIAGFGGSPLHARGLRNFAAPGSQLELESSAMPPTNGRQADFSEDETNKSSAEEAVDDVSMQQRTASATNERRKASAAVSSDPPTSDVLNELQPPSPDEDDYDDDYVDEDEKKIREDEKVARLIQQAEFAAALPTQENLRRASQVLKNGGSRKESTLQLATCIDTSMEKIEHLVNKMRNAGEQSTGQTAHNDSKENAIVKDEIDDTNAETRLSLTVSKADFERMIIVGQFNLGFIVAVRPAERDEDEDELFIIDQHAADEKYNYERLQRTVTLQSQRLVRPKPLDLTAMQEETILDHTDALRANGFEIETTSYITDDDDAAGRRCRLITLPMSKEKTFDLSDLEELLHLLSEAPAGSSEIPRPKKVQRMLAMRACRSSIMVGKTLALKQMRKVVRHMGEMEKPWNCPHGRPTMRHLAGLSAWNEWQEGEVVDPDDDDAGVAMGGRQTNWSEWLQRSK